MRRARASVATHTDAAPALSAPGRRRGPLRRWSKCRRQQNVLPATAAGSETENAPRTFRRRWRGVRPAWLSVARRRISVSGASVSRHCGWVLRRDSSAWAASSRAWLKPRSACFDRCSGTGTTSISAGASAASCAMPWPASGPAPAPPGCKPVVFQRVDGLLHAAPRKAHKPRPAQKAAAPAGRSGTSQDLLPSGAGASNVSPQRAQTSRRSGREIPSSRHHKLARKRAAAEGSRRGRRRREGGRNSRRPWDFEARGLRRANGKSPMVERRTSVNRSPCGRRTSLRRLLRSG